jgi:hypothetical protein
MQANGPVWPFILFTVVFNDFRGLPGVSNSGVPLRGAGIYVDDDDDDSAAHERE